jgi:hypothetical protein
MEQELEPKEDPLEMMERNNCRRNRRNYQRRRSQHFHTQLRNNSQQNREPEAVGTKHRYVDNEATTTMLGKMGISQRIA